MNQTPTYTKWGLAPFSLFHFLDDINPTLWIQKNLPLFLALVRGEHLLTISRLIDILFADDLKGRKRYEMPKVSGRYLG